VQPPTTIEEKVAVVHQQLQVEHTDGPSRGADASHRYVVQSAGRGLDGSALEDTEDVDDDAEPEYSKTAAALRSSTAPAPGRGGGGKGRPSGAGDGRVRSRRSARGGCTRSSAGRRGYGSDGDEDDDDVADDGADYEDTEGLVDADFREMSRPAGLTRPGQRRASQKALAVLGAVYGAPGSRAASRAVDSAEACDTVGDDGDDDGFMTVSEVKMRGVSDGNRGFQGVFGQPSSGAILTAAVGSKRKRMPVEALDHASHPRRAAVTASPAESEDVSSDISDSDSDAAGEHSSGEDRVGDDVSAAEAHGAVAAPGAPRSHALFASPDLPSRTLSRLRASPGGAPRSVLLFPGGSPPTDGRVDSSFYDDDGSAVSASQLLNTTVDTDMHSSPSNAFVVFAQAAASLHSSGGRKQSPIGASAGGVSADESAVSRAGLRRLRASVGSEAEGAAALLAASGLAFNHAGGATGSATRVGGVSPGRRGRGRPAAASLVGLGHGVRVIDDQEDERVSAGVIGAEGDVHRASEWTEPLSGALASFSSSEHPVVHSSIIEQSCSDEDSDAFAVTALVDGGSLPTDAEETQIHHGLRIRRRAAPVPLNGASVSNSPSRAVSHIEPLVPMHSSSPRRRTQHGPSASAVLTSLRTASSLLSLQSPVRHVAAAEAVGDAAALKVDFAFVPSLPQPTSEKLRGKDEDARSAFPMLDGLSHPVATASVDFRLDSASVAAPPSAPVRRESLESLTGNGKSGNDALPSGPGYHGGQPFDLPRHVVSSPDRHVSQSAAGGAPAATPPLKPRFSGSGGDAYNPATGNLAASARGPPFPAQSPMMTPLLGYTSPDTAAGLLAPNSAALAREGCNMSVSSEKRNARRAAQVAGAVKDESEAIRCASSRSPILFDSEHGLEDRKQSATSHGDASYTNQPVAGTSARKAQMAIDAAASAKTSESDVISEKQIAVAAAISV
jgi:hypothetical protein